MPIGPKGQKRPADVIGNAVKVMRIATGEEADDVQDDGLVHLVTWRSVSQSGNMKTLRTEVLFGWCVRCETPAPGGADFSRPSKAG